MIKYKNVILLTIDTLSFKRLGAGGNSPSPSPFIDKLIDENTSLMSHFSAGCPTQMAFPSLMSSSYPLDYNGYEFGIKDRPIVIAEIFKKEGYKTAAFTSGSGTEEYFSYDRGFNDYHSLADITLILNSFQRSFENYNKIKLEVASKELLIEKTENFLNYILILCKQKKIEKENNILTKTQFVHRWDYNKLSILIRVEIKKFNSNKEKFIEELINDSCMDFKKKILKFKRYKNYTFFLDKFTFKRAKLIKNVLNESRERFIKKSSFLRKSKDILRIFSQSWIQSSKNKNNFESGYSIFKNAKKWIQENKKSNFFLWLHITDLHEDRLFSPSFTDTNYRFNELKNNLSLIKDISNNSKYIGNPRYDVSIRLTDFLIEEFFKDLSALNLLDESLIILTSDHGSRRTGISEREYKRINSELKLGMVNEIHTTDFYEELYHVPAIFINPQLHTEKIQRLSSSIDIAPTILSLMGIEIPKLFRGKNLLNSTKEREYILMENLGPGVADFDIKPMRVGIRSKKIKLICQKYRGQNIEIIGIYNLEKDIHERENLVHSTKSITEIKHLYEIIAERFNEIEFANTVKTY